MQYVQPSVLVILSPTRIVGVLITGVRHNQTWGQVHEYLYLSTLKYKFESTCTLLKYFLNYRNVLVLILKYFCQVLEYLKYF